MAEKKSKVGEDATSAAAVEYTRHIWLAGLGAMARANEEGTKLFEQLVQEGEKVENRSREVVGSKAEDVRNMATSAWEDFMKRATGGMGDVEAMFEAQVNRTLSALGVATNEDINKLAKQVDELSKQVKSLSSAKSTKSSSSGTKSRSTSGSKTSKTTKK
ncbi:phasin family protein [Ectothiorhodospiraceae bacterium WFHF3C12]|nr:phasin family protein [Ectothiorhodospiraceae bacterium WFHF3C12]